MRSNCGRLALATSITLLAPLFPPQRAAADEVREQLQQMNERISQLEQQLQATHDELEATSARAASQQEVLERAGLGEGAEPRSALSRFLTETEFDGWVAASYWFNANQPNIRAGPGAGAATGSTNGNIGNQRLGFDTDGLGYRQHPDHNSFQVDQVWFAMSNAATPESRGGFGVDLVFGKTADTLRSDRTGGNLAAVYQAYAEYLAPLGPGILFRLGRFETEIGAERIGTVYNFNISRSNLRDLLQPNNHVGVTAGTRIGPVRLMIGGANDALLNLNSDINQGKTLLWAVGIDVTDTIAIDASGLWGDAGSPPLPADLPYPPGTDLTTAKRIGIVDLVIRWDPSDILAAWIDLEYLWTEGAEVFDPSTGPPSQNIPGDPRAFAVAAASRYGITERTAVSLRAEAILSKDSYLDPLGITGRDDQTLWSITGTLDHSFTEQLVVRVETRYDQGESPGSDSIFFQDADLGPVRQYQFVAGVEAYYRF
jgi:hypothetical protein